MPMLIPVNNYGNREIVVDTLGGGVYRFRSYFSQGMYDGWFVDIADSAGDALLKGIRVVPGCPNLLKGQGDRFRDVQMSCVVLNGRESTPDALGNGTYLAWFNPGEINPFDAGDPLIDIPYDEWAFHRETSNMFFESNGAGKVHVEGIVLGGSTDTLAVLSSDGTMRLKSTAASGAENLYMRLDASGNIAMKGL